MKYQEVNHEEITKEELLEIVEKLRATISQLNKSTKLLREEKEKLAVVLAEALHKINQLKKGVKYYSLDSENFTEEFDSMDTLVLYCLNNGVDPNAYVTVNDKKTNERLEDFLIE